MIPIFEQAGGRGLGYSCDEFLSRLDDILASKAKENQGVLLALILYDFENRAIKKFLRDQGVFTRLDRLVGDKLHIFYLHCPTTANRDFNEKVLQLLHFERRAVLPGILFFRYSKKEAHDFEYVELKSDRELYAFQELHTLVSERLAAEGRPRQSASRSGNALRRLTSGASFVAQETVKAAIRAGLGHLPF